MRFKLSKQSFFEQANWIGKPFNEIPQELEFDGVPVDKKVEQSHPVVAKHPELCWHMPPMQLRYFILMYDNLGNIIPPREFEYLLKSPERSVASNVVAAHMRMLRKCLVKSPFKIVTKRSIGYLLTTKDDNRYQDFSSHDESATEN